PVSDRTTPRSRAAGLPHEAGPTSGLADNLLPAQLPSKDAVKQAPAASLDDPGSCRPLGSIAMQAVWGSAAALPGTVVLDSWWFRPRELRFAAGLDQVGTCEVLEIWCDLPPDLARTRYARRDRPAMFEDAWHLANDWDDWASQAQPLALSAVLRVDISSPVDYPELAAAVLAQFAETPPANDTPD
ncbi:MAG: hypothetical protein M3Y77_17185, partial [Actinomycetota bacterium]|nr:hypothetical protein [Actinomycetota bacterium]